MAFKRRNLLQKLDTALNNVNLTSDEISNAPQETLQKAAQGAEEAKASGKKFKIDFPDLSDKKAQIFPLPIPPNPNYSRHCK